MRRAKIVCTIGPRTESADRIEALFNAGMDVARLNMSHGSHAVHEEVIGRLRALSDRLRQPLAILMDLQGPKIRLGKLDSELEVAEGEAVTLSVDPERADGVPLAYPSLLDDLAPGHRLLLDDGRVELEVTDIAAPTIRCEVVSGGELRSSVGVHAPGVELTGPTFTEKDEADLAFGLKHDVDFVALSFVQSSEDVARLRSRIEAAGSRAAVIAKLERAGAVENLEGILEVSDGVMVARGDLGVELPPERVPLIQKRIISAANRAGVFVITATQMLESMTESPRPTRAEASDVANAVLDGTDAVMLSGETAVGKHPIAAVRMMGRIVEQAESGRADIPLRRRDAGTGPLPFTDAISHAAVMAAEDVGARAIVAFTQSGSTARLISKRRPSVPIYAFTPHLQVWRQLCLCWGTRPQVMDIVDRTDEMVEAVESALRAIDTVDPGDILAILSGSPITAQGSTNLLKLHRVSGGGSASAT